MRSERRQIGNDFTSLTLATKPQQKQSNVLYTLDWRATNRHTTARNRHIILYRKNSQRTNIISKSGNTKSSSLNQICAHPSNARICCQLICGK